MGWQLAAMHQDIPETSRGGRSLSNSVIEPVRTPIILHGELGDRFGERFEIVAPTPAAAIRCLKANFDEFPRFIHESESLGMPYLITVNGEFISNDQLFGPVYGEIEFHPAVAGGGGAVPKLLIGGGLIAASFFMPAAFPLAIKTGLVSLGASLALQGITQLISPPRKPTEDKSFSIVNSFNTSPQGTPVPILVGEFFIPLGTAVVLSSSTEIRDIPVSGGGKSTGSKFFGK